MSDQTKKNLHQRNMADCAVDLPLRTQAAYGASFLGYQFINWMMSGYLTIFYTDVFGIDAGILAIVVWCMRVFDAVIDPFIGRLSDRTNTRFGGYRVWVLFGGIATSVASVLMFWAHPDWSSGLKVAYVFATYTLTTLSMSCYNIPFGSLAGAMSTSAYTREKLTNWRMIATNVGMLLCVWLFSRIVGAVGSVSQTNPYFSTALLVGVCAIPLWVITFAGVKEIVPKHAAEKVSVKMLVKTVTGNKPLIIALIGILVYGFAVNGRAAVLSYYMVYVAGSAGFTMYYMLPVVIGSVVTAPLVPKLMKLVPNKGHCAAIGAGAAGIFGILVFFLPPHTNPVLFVILSLLFGISTNIFGTYQWGMLPDCADYSYYATGQVNTGYVSAYGSFVYQLGGAFAGSAVMALLSAFGYVPNQAQAPEVLTGLNLLFSVIPGVMLLIAAVIFCFFKLSVAKHEEVVKYIAEREAGKTQNGE